jgi:phage/plasmid-associated DNA primase
MSKMFSFIKNYENPIEIIGQNPPMTAYKSRLIAFSLDAITSFFYKKIDSYSADEESNQTTRTIQSITLYDMVVRYAKESKLQSNFTIKNFGIKLKKLMDVSEGRIYKKHTKNGEVYCFPTDKEILKILKNYNKEIYLALGRDKLEEGFDV